MPRQSDSVVAIFVATSGHSGVDRILRKAEKLGVPVMDEEQFLKLIGG